MNFGNRSMADPDQLPLKAQFDSNHQLIKNQVNTEEDKGIQVRPLLALSRSKRADDTDVLMTHTISSG